MGATCCRSSKPDPQRNHAGYRKVLWAVLGFAADSVSLQADAPDFAGDAANYGISLSVSGLALYHRARAAIVKGISTPVFGLWVVGRSVWHVALGTVREASTMGLVGFAALLANAITLTLLWAYRDGDSNMQPIWLCSRNDVIGNCAVVLAAFGVFGTSRAGPDVIVAVIMAALAIHTSWVVSRTPYSELAQAAA
jgi:Co/Zn/Cd efflux system component